ncbi:putative oryzin precursor [Paramyrothecium foliicola]|nr:putative oryzin precursor [Paramyrothecium foliicola]
MSSTSLTELGSGKTLPQWNTRGSHSAQLDANVFAALPEAEKVLDVEDREVSARAKTYRVTVRLFNGTEAHFFMKVSVGYHGREALKGEFTSTSAIHSVVPSFCPKPIAWGTFASDSDTHFYVCKFHDFFEGLPDPESFCKSLAQLHSAESSNGKFGFGCVTYNGNLPQNNTWSDSWEEFFSNSLRQVLKVREERAGPHAKLDRLIPLLFEMVIPRLLRPLESGDQAIKPSLVHGDLWCGNVGIVDNNSGEGIVYDPASFWAHHEYELGNWRAERNMFTQKYFQAYHSHMPMSKPIEDFEDRNALYALSFTPPSGIMKFTTTICTFSGLLSLVLAGAPIKNDGISADILVPDTYIVTYKAEAKPADIKKHQDAITKKSKKKSKKGVIEAINLDGLQGYVAEVPPSELNEIVDSKLVAYIEKDSVVNITAVAAEPEKLGKRAPVSQPAAPWGLARISHRLGGNSGSFASNYYYDNSAGSGVRVYVIDTGIRTSHVEFEGRAVWGANFISGSPNTDEYGHGTHVAGTVAGKTYGVAKRATVVAIKTLDKNGAGTMSGAILGLNWAVNNARARGIARRAVVNMSLGGSYTYALNAAVRAATDAGLTVVVSAGNSNSDASYYSPASAPTAITVGAVEGTNDRAWFSNYGSLVDIFAPGVSTLSAYHTSNTATRYFAGTSMAAPHVAGLAAYFIAKENLWGYAAVSNRIYGAATAGVVRDPQGSWNRLAYNAAGA